MKPSRRFGIWLGVYVAIVVAVECAIGFMGAQHAERGLEPSEDWVVITTTDTEGRAKSTVVAGVESDGALYVAANHWPRAWYRRAIANPNVEVQRKGEKFPARAVPVSGAERTRIAEQSSLPWAIRLLTGFPPRSFLRLDPR